MRDFVVHFVVWGKLGAILVHKTGVDRISSKSHVITATPAYVSDWCKENERNGQSPKKVRGSSLKAKAKKAKEGRNACFSFSCHSPFCRNVEQRDCQLSCTSNSQDLYSPN